MQICLFKSLIFCKLSLYLQQTKICKKSEMTVTKSVFVYQEINQKTNYSCLKTPLSIIIFFFACSVYIVRFQKTLYVINIPMLIILSTPNNNYYINATKRLLQRFKIFDGGCGTLALSVLQGIMIFL